MLIDNIEANALRCGIPDDMVGGIERWIKFSVNPGNFLTAVMENNLREAVGRGDAVNQRLLPNYVQFFYNYAPAQCWGSPEKVKAWAERPLTQHPDDGSDDDETAGHGHFDDPSHAEPEGDEEE
jgi:hypothetical protein